MKRKRPSKDASNDDTPRSFARIMAFHLQGIKPHSGLDDGTAKSKKRESSTGGSKQNSSLTAETSADVISRIKPGERMSEYSARVDAALPLSKLINKGKNGVQSLPGVKQPRTKMERKMHRMYKEWREVEAKRKEKVEEEREEIEDGNLGSGDVAYIGDKPRTGRKRKGPSSEDDDPWAVVGRDREARARSENATNRGLVGLHDVVTAPPRLSKVPREKFRVTNGAKVDVIDVPGSAGSLRRREELGLARRSVVEGYRQMMKERKGFTALV